MSYIGNLRKVPGGWAQFTKIKKKKMQENPYEKALNLYKENLDEWRIFLYENMKIFMRKNPLLRHKNYTFTKDDILSEAFLIWDEILLRKDIPDEKKISKLWYLFNRWGWALYNKLNQYGAESYTIDDIRDSDSRSYDMDVDMLQYVLVVNNIISPLEAKVLQYVWEWRGKYEIARLMKTTYYNVRDIVDTIWLKIKRFLEENDLEDATNS